MAESDRLHNSHPFCLLPKILRQLFLSFVQSSRDELRHYVYHRHNTSICYHRIVLFHGLTLGTRIDLAPPRVYAPERYLFTANDA